MKDFKPNIAVVHLLDPADLVKTDTVTSILDLAHFDGAAISVVIGAVTGLDGDNYLTPVLEESDTTKGTDFDAVDAADINGAFTKVDAATKDQTTQTVGYKGHKRYIRVALKYTGAGISASLVGAVGILGYPDFFPAVGPAPITAT